MKDKKLGFLLMLPAIVCIIVALIMCVLTSPIQTILPIVIVIIASMFGIGLGKLIF